MTASPAIALTRIRPPRPRSGLVARTALEQSLVAALTSRRAVLLCAPAGFGKTSALTAALERAGDTLPVAWVSLDEDDDLQRLLGCLFAALEPFDPPWRVAPEALVAADAVVNTLAATERGHAVIVLDDLHRVEDPAVFDFLDALIERLPAGLT
jgi:LuxR family maltose regulon positive regulatory protein